MAPAEPPNAASTILWWLRRPGHERQLTDCMGDLARVDPAIARGLAASVLEAAEAQAHGRQAVELAAALRGALPEALTCSREETTGKLVVRERSWWRKEQSRSGRLDWVFHPPGQERTQRDFQLAVEVKIGAGLTRHQLADYRLHLTRKARRPSGTRRARAHLPRPRSAERRARTLARCGPLGAGAPPPSSCAPERSGARGAVAAAARHPRNPRRSRHRAGDLGDRDR